MQFLTGCRIIVQVSDRGKVLDSGPVTGVKSQSSFPVTTMVGGHDSLFSDQG